MARKRFTERETIATLISQGVTVFCYRCRIGFDIRDEIEREHILEIALGGKDDPPNCVYSHKACHATITRGTKATTAGSSAHRIAKVKRIRGETCTGPKKQINSRGFSKQSRPMTRTRSSNARDINSDREHS